MRTVKQILMDRDGMMEDDADGLIDEFKDELEALINHSTDPISSYEDATAMVEDYFGLEPDYLDEFLVEIM